MSDRTAQEAAAQVLWHYCGKEHPEGIRAGAFFEALISAIAKADIHNRLLLAKAFPAEVTFAHLIETVPSGVEVIRSIARGDVPEEMSARMVNDMANFGLVE